MNVCAGCFGNDHFSRWVSENGQPGICDFCDSDEIMTAVVSIEDIAEEADRIFRGKYQLGEECRCFSDDDKTYYEQRGDPYSDLLAEELACDESVLSAIIEKLPDCSDRDISQGEEPFYDDCTNYELISDAEERDRQANEEHWYENRFTYQWDDFCRTVKFERRFFKIQEILDELFGEKQDYENGNIKPVYMLERGRKIYRARQLGNGLTGTQLQENPSQALSAPPPQFAVAGRMNVEFIPVFYAAFNKETAVSELRPSKGDTVIVGEFLVKDAIKVFDFTAFDVNEGDDPFEKYSHTRYDFIKQMQEAISRPVGATEKPLEYIPTQIAAEYLREIFNCDAIIYDSSIVGDRDAGNRNIAIFRGKADFIDDECSSLEFVGYETCSVSAVRYELHISKF